MSCVVVAVIVIVFVPTITRKLKIHGPRTERCCFCLSLFQLLFKQRGMEEEVEEEEEWGVGWAFAQG